MTSAIDPVVDGIVDNSKAVIVLMLLLTAAIGAGAPRIEQTSSLDQFRTGSTAAEKLDYLQANFTTGDENTTTAQIVVRDGNVLSKESLLSIMAYERALRTNETIQPTLVAENAITGIPNVIATTAIVQERSARLRELAARLQRRQAALQANRTALAERRRTVNATARALREALARLERTPNASVEAAFEGVRAQTPVDLRAEDLATFRRAARALRTADNRTERRQAYRLGTRGILRDEYAALQARADALQQRAGEIRALAERVQAIRQDLQNGTSPTFQQQVAQLESMNATEIDRTIRAIFDGEDNQQVLAFMPTGYDPGSTRAKTTMLIVRQTTSGSTGVQAAASDRIVEAQLAMREIGEKRPLEYMVFGAGIISHELTASMTDSLLIVGPLAILFVLVTLIIAYRDLLDILLGLAGIGTVLIWTFGFMGWADIAFNQIFVAVPVLLIGLSIDYAIHVFMRHREHRESSDDPTRGSMKTALAGVGLALVWVTATTVIGFLSNLVSPVAPIREFGIVSAVGIVAALLVFGALVPAVKIELDELFEGWGFDRTKPAFGTGGGRFSRVLGVGATLARKAPHVVLLVALVVTAAGAYGGTMVDTSFQQKDFLADDPPDWMNRLPQPFDPHQYSAKENLEYVNEHFVRRDSQVQILIQGDVTDPITLERLQRGVALAAEKNVTQDFASGEAAITGPVEIMRRVAARNASFNETLRAADGPDAGVVPDRNLERVYDALFAVAPNVAQRVIHRTDAGEYRALRLVITVEGGASGDEIVTQMRDVAAFLDTAWLDATATGRPILNEIVQDELFRTVVQSLLITLVAIFVFLAGAYRLTEGSATLGIVTLVPVALTVAWILGTMYLLGIPFNVLTGTITSLTVGLGVAYSIHVSERYTLELERNGSIWDAMRTTVTGTGGALLGSAATTVGGFGVLAFAILPPLQQFGIITAITIIYAFLSSVLVLPSLLVVWTRFVEPEEAGEMTFPDDSGIGEAEADDAATGGSATRRTEYEHARPGQELPVTVTLSGFDDRVVVEEVVSGGVPTLEDADPEPVDAVARGSSVFASFELDDGTGSLSYRVRVPDEAAEDETVTFEGRTHTPDGDRAVEGDERVSVVTDLFERVLARGEVTEDDLRLAGQQYAEGRLTDRQYQRIQREWLSDADETAVDDEDHGERAEE